MNRERDSVSRGNLYRRRFLNIPTAERIVKTIGMHDDFLGINQREIQRIIKSSSNDTFESCIRQLRNYGVITSKFEDKKTNKKTVPLYLTANGKRAYKLDLVVTFLTEINRLIKRNRREEEDFVIRVERKEKRRKSKESQEEKRVKAFYFFLTRGAYWTMSYKSADPSDLEGSILIDNKLYKGDFLEGVSIMDLVEQRDKSFALIFAYIKSQRQKQSK